VIRFGQPAQSATFEREILPHLDAAFSLARFLLRNDQDAEDAVQEAALRAFRFFDSFRGENSRAWFLKIVRNTAFNSLKRTRDHEDIVFDEELHTPQLGAGNESIPALTTEIDREAVRAAIQELPPEFREVITLRELENCSYKEIADIGEIPVGTVMSRLARARTQLGQILAKTFREAK
jgi:RNA polymerase sigma-70 factor (ECF subfamily)